MVGRAQTLLPTNTRKESGSQTLGKAEKGDKDSGLDRKAPAPSLSYSINRRVTSHPGCLGLSCFIAPWTFSLRQTDKLANPTKGLLPANYHHNKAVSFKRAPGSPAMGDQVQGAQILQQLQGV